MTSIFEILSGLSLSIRCRKLILGKAVFFSSGAGGGGGGGEGDVLLCCVLDLTFP